MNIIHVNNGQFFLFDGKSYLKLANRFFCMDELNREVGFHDDCGIEAIAGQIACTNDGVVTTFYGEEALAGAHQEQHKIGDEIVETCYFCNNKVPSGQEAVDGWSPSFWDEETDEEVPEPVCPNCQRVHLHFDEENGDYVRKVAITPY